MSLLQSALDFLAGPGSLGGAAGRDQSDFVGQTVELGELRLRVRRVLAEGGFAFVYEAQDLGSGREYALKDSWWSFSGELNVKALYPATAF